MATTTPEPEQPGITLYDLAVELGFDGRRGMNPVGRLRGATGTTLVPLAWDRDRVLSPAEADAIRRDADHWAERNAAIVAADLESSGADRSSRFD